jgi:hypothetical protein
MNTTIDDNERTNSSVDALEKKFRHKTKTPIPLAVLTRTEPFQLQPGSLPAGITSESWAAIDTAFVNAQRYFVELVPTTPQVFARQWRCLPNLVNAGLNVYLF